MLTVLANGLAEGNPLTYIFFFILLLPALGIISFTIIDKLIKKIKK